LSRRTDTGGDEGNFRTAFDIRTPTEIRPAGTAGVYERVNEAAATCATDLLRQWDQRHGPET
jgi:hypothetical protein